MALISRGLSLACLNQVFECVDRAFTCCGLALVARPCFAARVRSSARGSGLRWWARVWATPHFLGFCFVSRAAHRVLLQCLWFRLMFCTFRWFVSFAGGLLYSSRSWLRFSLFPCSALFAAALTSRGFGVVRLDQVFLCVEHE